MKTLTKNFCLILTSALFVQFNVWAQSEGDFRSKKDGNWNSKSTWEKYDDGEWENSNKVPSDENATVAIISGHTVKADKSAKVGHLIIESGAKLYRNSSSSAKTIKLYGDLTVNGILGNGSTMDKLLFAFEGSSSNIGGSGECKFYAITKTSNEDICDLTINMNVELYATSGKSIYNQKNNKMLNVIVNPGVDLTTHAVIDLNNGTSNKRCSLYIKSNETGTASLITPDIDDSDASNTTVERYLTENMWHYVSSPVDDLPTSAFYDIYLMTYKEIDGSWRYIVNADTTLDTDMQGFASWTSSYYLGNTTVQFNGELNTGYKSIALTNTSNEENESNGYNFVGNPYSSALDWDYDGDNGWIKTNVDNAIYLWNPETSNYDTYIDGDGTNGADGIIPANQGYFVHCNDENGVLAVDHGAQVHANSKFYKGSEEIEENVLNIFAEGTTGIDETIIRFKETSTEEFDGYCDAYKMMGSSSVPQIFSICNEENLSINSMPYEENMDPVKIGFQIEADGVYTIKWTGLIGLEEGLNIILEDVKADNKINLFDYSEYSFSYEEGDAQHRFNLYFKKSIVTEIEENSLNMANVYSFGKKIHVDLMDSDECDVMIYNMLGQHVASKKVSHKKETIDVTESGYYIVRLIDENFSKAIKVYVK